MVHRQSSWFRLENLMPDFSLSDMPWLMQTADTGASLAKGASAGAAIANARAQRQSLAQRRYEFEQARQLQQRDQTLQEKLAPLQEQALRMQNDLGTYKLDELKRQLTMREANAKIVNEVGGLVLQSVLSGQAADPQSVTAVADLVSRAPNKNDPELLKWLDVYNEGVKAQHTIKQQQFQPGFGAGTNPVTGQPQAFFRTGPNSAQLLESETSFKPEVTSVVDPNTQKPLTLVRTGQNTWSKVDSAESVSNFGKMIQERQAALAKGDTEAVRLYDEQFAGKGWQLQFDEQGRVTGMTEGPIKGATTPQAMTTKLTERMSQALEGITALTELQGDVRWKDVGVPGVLGELVFDTALPMLGIPAGDIQRMATRQKIILTREGLMRDISGDSRFNQADRAAVEASLPKSGLLTTKTQLQEAAQVTKQTLAKRAALDAIDLKQTPPKWALENMTDKQIDALLGSNVITPQMLLQAIESGFSKERAIKLWQARPRG